MNINRYVRSHATEVYPPQMPDKCVAFIFMDAKKSSIQMFKTHKLVEKKQILDRNQN